MVTLPSGKEVEIRKMRLSDQNIMVNPEYIRKGTTLDKLLEAVSGQSESELETWLIGDRVFAMIYLRRISRGDIYSPKTTCPNCKDRRSHEIDLSELKVQMLDKEKVSENFEFELRLPECGKKLTARLLTGKEEKQLRQIRREHPGELMTYLMMLRTVSIEDVRHKNIKWFEDLEGDAEYFRQKYDKRDCGVETEIELYCNACENVFDIELPFDKTFFFGSSTPKKSSMNL
jgi:hypothetical protein